MRIITVEIVHKLADLDDHIHLGGVIFSAGQHASEKQIMKLLYFTETKTYMHMHCMRR